MHLVGWKPWLKASVLKIHAESLSALSVKIHYTWVYESMLYLYNNNKKKTLGSYNNMSGWHYFSLFCLIMKVFILFVLPSSKFSSSLWDWALADYFFIYRLCVSHSSSQPYTLLAESVSSHGDDSYRLTPNEKNTRKATPQYGSVMISICSKWKKKMFYLLNKSAHVWQWRYYRGKHIFMPHNVNLNAGSGPALSDSPSSYWLMRVNYTFSSAVR